MAPRAKTIRKGQHDFGSDTVVDPFTDRCKVCGLHRSYAEDALGGNCPTSRADQDALDDQYAWGPEDLTEKSVKRAILTGRSLATLDGKTVGDGVALFSASHPEAIDPPEPEGHAVISHYGTTDGASCCIVATARGFIEIRANAGEAAPAELNLESVDRFIHDLQRARDMVRDGL